MQFILIDRILELEPGRRIVGIKNLTLAEEYLSEHFPGFPVLPGVLMLEAAAQAAAWLIRVTEDYAHSLITLKSAKAVRYGSFVTPGGQLLIEAKVTRMAEHEADFQVKGTVEGVSAISGRITMESSNLRDRDAILRGLDNDVVGALRRQFMLIGRDWQRRSDSAADAESANGAMLTI